MKTKVVMTLCVVFVLAVATTAHAQLMAGSEESKAYGKLMAETNPDAKLALVDDYVKTYPNSKVLSDIYVAAMQVYEQKNDSDKTIEWGEKAIQLDGGNFTALMAVSRFYSIEHKNSDRAISYAQKAIDSIASLKKQPAPPGQSEAQWKQYIDSLDKSAENLLAYAKAMKP